MPHHDADRNLAERVLGGSIEAWHEFVERYSTLIHGTLREHLIVEDQDEVRSTYVDLLYDLYHGKLASYEGRSKLSTWLVLVARHAAFDRMRRLYGRRRDTAAWRALDPVTREVYRLVVVEGLSFASVRQLARPQGPALSEPELLAALARMRTLPLGPALGRPRMRTGLCGSPRLSVEAYARHLEQLGEEAADRRDPDAVLAHGELLQLQRRLARGLRSLPAQERRVLYLRFWRNLSARAIAQRLGLTKQRQAYSSIDRALRKLRIAFEADREGP